MRRLGELCRAGGYVLPGGWLMFRQAAECGNLYAAREQVRPFAETDWLPSSRAAGQAAFDIVLARIPPPPPQVVQLGLFEEERP